MTMLDAHTTREILLPKTFHETTSVYEDLYNTLHTTKNSYSLKNNPQSILSTIEMFGKQVDMEASLKFKHHANLVQSFIKYDPASILLTGVENDLAYSLIYLTYKFHTSNPLSNFKVYAVLSTANMNLQDIRLFEYLIQLTGLSSHIELITGSSTYSTLKTLRQYHFDWVLINHANELQDMESLKMLESLSFIQPGIYLGKINIHAEASIFNKYLVATPMLKRSYMFKVNKSKYTGRWNLIYNVVETDANGPVLFKCTDFLDA